MHVAQAVPAPHLKDEYLVSVRQVGLDGEESWEPMSRMLEFAPVVLKELKSLGLSSDDKKELGKRYGFSF